MGRPCFLCGLFTGYIARTSAGSQYRVWYRVPSSYQDSDGKGCRKSWLQQWLQSWIRGLQRKSVVVNCSEL
jgi:hypothetical protein